MIALSKAPFVMEGSSVEFEKTVLPHFDAAYNLARWLTRDASDAEDVVQEAYMRAFKFFSGFKGGDSKSWILRIVRNTCYSWLQKNRPSDIVYDLNEDMCEDSRSSPEIQMIETANLQLLKQQIDSLPALFKEVIVLRDIEGLSYKEIASVVELPVGTVMSRLARGRGRLQKGMGVHVAGGQK